MDGYTGTALIVDLTARKATEQALPPALLRAYLGGAGLAVRLLYDHLEPGTDALAPGNVIVFGCGVFAGTIVAASAKHAVATKSPLTGMIGDAMAGSFFAHTMKRAGYDAVVIKGRAEAPTYLFIDDDQVFFRDARALWGLGSFATEEAIRVPGRCGGWAASRPRRRSATSSAMRRSGFHRSDRPARRWFALPVSATTAAARPAAPGRGRCSGRRT
jgi:aldehyde:ferredoxin oxidoreductase